MTREDLTSPVAAAATAQVKLCPYDEEEQHIWVRLIKAQFAVAGIKSQELKYANALASLPKQVLQDILLLMSVVTQMSRSTF
jgi:phenylalanine-4-hydroxylase